MFLSFFPFFCRSHLLCFSFIFCYQHWIKLKTSPFFLLIFKKILFLFLKQSKSDFFWYRNTNDNSGDKEINIFWRLFLSENQYHKKQFLQMIVNWKTICSTDETVIFFCFMIISFFFNLLWNKIFIFSFWNENFNLFFKC